MITDSYLAPVLEKELVFEESGDLIFATPPKKTPVKPGPAYVAPVITPENAELARKMQIAGLVGLGWIS